MPYIDKRGLAPLWKNFRASVRGLPYPPISALACSPAPTIHDMPGLLKRIPMTLATNPAKNKKKVAIPCSFMVP